VSAENSPTQNSGSPTRGKSEGRLQRAAAAGGAYISTFRQVVTRHGTTMGLIALGGLLLTQPYQALATTTQAFAEIPWAYFAAGGVLVIFFAFYQLRRGRGLSQRNGFWLGYLLYISVVEEVAFRLVLPTWLEGGIGFTTAVVLSNLIFAGIHYVTLRWRWRNCVFTFVGGLGFSHMLNLHQDLVLVILAHWFFTFLNTPVPPSRADKLPPSNS
jgi:membrane protease YdiL (CAAX protease family)